MTKFSDTLNLMKLAHTAILLIYQLMQSISHAFKGLARIKFSGKNENAKIAKLSILLNLVI